MADPMTDEELAAIKAREKAATKGPWRWWTSNSMRRLSSDPSGKDGDVAHAYRASDGVPDIAIREEDMAFTEHARTDVPRLLVEVERLQGGVERARGEERAACLADIRAGLPDAPPAADDALCAAIGRIEIRARREKLTAIRADRTARGGVPANDPDLALRDTIASSRLAGVSEEAIAAMLRAEVDRARADERAIWERAVKDEADSWGGYDTVRKACGLIIERAEDAARIRARGQGGDRG